MIDSLTDISLARLVAEYGYLAVFCGTLLEGEVLLVLAGFAAYQGHLSIITVIAVAFCGATIGDQMFFFIGRRYGNALLERFPGTQARAQRIHRLLLRHHPAIIIGVRFAYGLRILGPIVIGTTPLPAWRFMFFNALGAAIWAPLIAGAGYLFGQTLELLLADLKAFETVALLVIVAVAVIAALVHRARRRRRPNT